MREYKITTNTGDVFYVRATSAIHARQVAGKRVNAGEWIESIDVV